MFRFLSFWANVGALEVVEAALEVVGGSDCGALEFWTVDEETRAGG